MKDRNIDRISEERRGSLLDVGDERVIWPSCKLRTQFGSSETAMVVKTIEYRLKTLSKRFSL